MSGYFTSIRRVAILLVAAIVVAGYAPPSLADEPLEPRWKVVTPGDYDPSRAYPLFILLHGANSYLEDMLPAFKLDRHKGDYLLAFIQSTEKAPEQGFTWHREIDKGRDEIRRSYKEITEEYSVDKRRVIIGGFSAGGTMAIDVVLSEIIPIVGFVGVCPGKPWSFSSDSVKAAAERGVRGVMIAGEEDYYGPRQFAMAAVFDKAGLQYKHIVIPGFGHDYPGNLSERLDRAIEFVDPHLRDKIDSTN
jgi:poly(3-hydroxybutyrate) depolymerase